MNRRITPWLLLTVALLGGAAWWTQHTRQGSGPGSGSSTANRILAIDRAALTQVRVRRDYWNSFTLVRRPNGSWDLVEPSTEAANQETVKHFLETLVNLPSLKTFETPANDSERYRQYGLWSPKLTITAYTAEREHTVLFGNEADDQSGTYCAVQGKDEVYLTQKDSVAILSTELTAYRQVPGATNSSIAK